MAEASSAEIERRPSQEDAAPLSSGTTTTSPRIIASSTTSEVKSKPSSPSDAVQEQKMTSKSKKRLSVSTASPGVQETPDGASTAQCNEKNAPNASGLGPTTTIAGRRERRKSAPRPSKRSSDATEDLADSLAHQSKTTSTPRTTPEPSAEQADSHQNDSVRRSSSSSKTKHSRMKSADVASTTASSPSSDKSGSGNAAGQTPSPSGDAALKARRRRSARVDKVEDLEEETTPQEAKREKVDRSHSMKESKSSKETSAETSAVGKDSASDKVKKMTTPPKLDMPAAEAERTSKSTRSPRSARKSPRSPRSARSPHLGKSESVNSGEKTSSDKKKADKSSSSSTTSDTSKLKKSESLKGSSSSTPPLGATSLPQLDTSKLKKSESLKNGPAAASSTLNSSNLTNSASTSSTSSTSSTASTSTQGSNQHNGKPIQPVTHPANLPGSAAKKQDEDILASALHPRLTAHSSAPTMTVTNRPVSPLGLVVSSAGLLGQMTASSAAPAKLPPLPGSRNMSPALTPSRQVGVAKQASPIANPARIYAQPVVNVPAQQLPPSASLLPAGAPNRPPDALTVRSGSGSDFIDDHNKASVLGSASPPRPAVRLPSGPSPAMPVNPKMMGPPAALPGSASIAIAAAPAPVVEVPVLSFDERPSARAGDSGLAVSFDGRGYSEFPKRIIDTQGITSISGGENQLSELPITLAAKTLITRLEFPSNQFKELPLVVTELPNLKYLDFSKNKIAMLAAGITSSTSLTTLLLGNNRLKTFPNHICVLSKLENLDLSGNRIKTLPPQLGNLNSLVELNLASCEIDALPAEIGRLNKLETLLLHHNSLSKLPYEMGGLISLRKLDLSYNVFDYTPPSLFYATRVTDLNLERNEITELEEDVIRLIYLSKLNLDFNKLTTLPIELAHLDFLNDLSVTGNPLSAQGSALSGLATDRLQDGGSIMAYLKQKKKKRISAWKRRKLVFVGEEFVGKTSLRMALLNSFSTKNTRKKRKNRGTQLQNGVANEAADTVATDGIDIEDWEPQEDHTGEGSSANTPTTNSSASSSSTSSNSSTANADADEEPITFSTWDFAGQQIYHPTHQFFITSRSMYLVVFNLLDERMSRIEYWLKTLKVRTGGKCPVLIVGTHRDDKRCDGPYVDSVLTALRKRFSSRFPFVRDFLAVSSKTGKGLNKLTETLLALARSNVSFKDIPPTYARLEKAIYQLRVKNSTMSVDEFSRVVLNAGVPKTSISSCLDFLHDVGLIMYFNDKNGGLADLVILDPTWIVRLLSSVITLKHNYAKDGFMMASTLPHIWKEYPPEEYNWLLKLLDKFEITVRLSSMGNEMDMTQGVRTRWMRTIMEGQREGGDRRQSLTFDTNLLKDLIIIPSLLPMSPAETHMSELWTDATLFQPEVWGRRYVFQFLPLGFFSRLIVRTLHMAGLLAQYVWREGMIVDTETERAMLIHNEADYLLDIVVKKKKRGSDATTSPPNSASTLFAGGTETAGKRAMAMAFNLLRQLSDCIETLLVSWFQLKVIVKVPCHLCLQEKMTSLPDLVPYYFSIEECMLAVREGQESVTCLADHSVLRQQSRKKSSRASARLSTSFSGNFDTQTSPEKSISSLSTSVADLDSLSIIHQCLLKELCSDIAFSDVSDLTINYEELHVGKVIGAGSFAELRTGTYNGEVVAVKVLKNQNSGGASGQQLDLLSDSFRELQHETFVMKNLKNPYLVELKGITTHPLAMVMDYFPLGSLDGHLRDEKVTHPCLSWKYRVRLALNIARGMDYLHSEDFIHRDLRSPNILIASRDENQETVAKVADFGLAVLCAKGFKGGDFNECWTAPEILKATSYNSKVDNYSYGIVLWELLELGHPFKEYEHEFASKPRLDFFDAIIAGLRPTFPSWVPQDYQNLIKACWATEPEDRPPFARVAEILTEMEPVAAQWDAGNLEATVIAPGQELAPRTLLRKKSKGGNLLLRMKAIQSVSADSILK